MTTTINYNDLLNEAINNPGEIAACYSYFHKYSIFNQTLLYCQGCKSPVATYKQWQDLGRNVIKGSKAKEICRPFFKKEYNEKGEKIDIFAGFTFVKAMFTLEETEGEEYKNEEVKFPTLNKDNLLNALGIEQIPFEDVNGNKQGYAYTGLKQIAINPLATYPQKTLLHEIAHCLLHGETSETFNSELCLSQNIKEVEAETTAYIIGVFLNILSDDEKIASRGYIQHWAQLNPIEDKTAKRIFGAVDKIYKALTK